MTALQPVETPAQIARVSRLAYQIWTEHYLPIIGQEQVTYMLDTFQSPAAIANQLRDSYRYVLAEQPGEALGYAAVQPRPQSLFLSKLYTRREARGHGVGSRLLQWAVNEARAHRLPTLSLTVNKHNADSIGWYHRRGFQIIEAMVTDIGQGFVMDDYLMRLTVPDDGSAPHSDSPARQQNG